MKEKERVKGRIAEVLDQYNYHGYVRHNNVDALVNELAAAVLGRSLDEERADLLNHAALHPRRVAAADRRSAVMPT